MSMSIYFKVLVCFSCLCCILSEVLFGQSENDENATGWSSVSVGNSCTCVQARCAQVGKPDQF